MFTSSFKTYIENLWGNIPSTTKKPSDGWPSAQQLSMSSNSKGGGGGNQPMMMDKEDPKKKKKEKK